jgi:hypothetical protein
VPLRVELNDFLHRGCALMISSTDHPLQRFAAYSMPWTGQQPFCPPGLYCFAVIRSSSDRSLQTLVFTSNRRNDKRRGANYMTLSLPARKGLLWTCHVTSAEQPSSGTLESQRALSTPGRVPVDHSPGIPASGPMMVTLKFQRYWKPTNPRKDCVSGLRLWCADPKLRSASSPD